MPAFPAPAFAAALLLVTASTMRAVDPPARAHHAFIYDEARQRILLVGGSTPLDNGSRFEFRWQQLATTGPEARAMGQLAYDKTRDRIVLFGGRKGYPNGDLNDTWEWDGKSWTRVASAR